MLLLPDLYQLCGSCYGSHQNVFAAAFPMEKQLILFDTGLDAADLGIIRDNLLLWGLDSFQISHVFLTHSHFDHTGNARSFLKKRCTASDRRRGCRCGGKRLRRNDSLLLWCPISGLSCFPQACGPRKNQCSRYCCGMSSGSRTYQGKHGLQFPVAWENGSCNR